MSASTGFPARSFARSPFRSSVESVTPSSSSTLKVPGRSASCGSSVLRGRPVAVSLLPTSASTSSAPCTWRWWCSSTSARAVNPPPTQKTSSPSESPKRSPRIRTLPAMNMAENVATFSTSRFPSTTRRVWSAAWPSSSSPFSRTLPETTSGSGPTTSESVSKSPSWKRTPFSVVPFHHEVSFSRHSGVATASTRDHTSCAEASRPQTFTPSCFAAMSQVLPS
ncbi:hypothetical protein [Archangium lansingense]|uniref:Uncharacterized protein n=1 Tax=Archangium lansingense TaxID=2995310 RepID=A0ABT4ACZ3_9BACT|nr:hypothetical protein [Archangium lansinium]MCY1078774.1 hypothetical protein [Archangium lansinium]